MFLNKNLWLRLLLFSRGRSSRENIVVWSWSWSCVTVAFIHITGCQWVSLNHSWGGRNHFTGPSEPQQSLPVCCLTISMPMSVQYRCAAWAVSALVAKSSDLIGRIVYWDPKNRAGFENAANSSSETIQLLWKTTLCVHLRRPLDIWSTSLHMVVGDIKERHTHIWRSKSSWHTRLFPIVVPRLAQTKQHIRTNRPIVIEDDDLGLLCSLSFLQSVICRALLCTAECPGGQLSAC